MFADPRPALRAPLSLRKGESKKQRLEREKVERKAAEVCAAALNPNMRLRTTLTLLRQDQIRLETNQRTIRRFRRTPQERMKQQQREVLEKAKHAEEERTRAAVRAQRAAAPTHPHLLTPPGIEHSALRTLALLILARSLQGPALPCPLFLTRCLIRRLSSQEASSSNADGDDDDDDEEAILARRRKAKPTFAYSLDPAVRGPPPQPPLVFVPLPVPVAVAGRPGACG